MAWIQQGPGQGWVNTAGDPYDPATYMSDADYQKMIGKPLTGIEQIVGRHPGVAYTAPATVGAGQTLQDGWDSGLATQAPAPTPEILARGAMAVIADIMQNAGPYNGGIILQGLHANGYFQQFPDYTPAIGEHITGLVRQAEGLQEDAQEQAIQQTASVVGPAAAGLGLGALTGAGTVGADAGIFSGMEASGIANAADAMGMGGSMVGAGVGTEAGIFSGMEAGDLAGAGNQVSNTVGGDAGIFSGMEAGDLATTGNQVVTGAGNVGADAGVFSGMEGGDLSGVGGVDTLAGGAGTDTLTGGGNAATGGTSGGSAGTGAGGGSTGTAGGAAGAGSIWDRLANGTATAADWMQLFGTLGAAGIDYSASDKASERLDALARDYMALGAPSRARYEASFDPNFNPSSMAGFDAALDTSANSLARAMSVKGNPFGNPAAQAEIMKYVTGNVALPAISDYRRVNAGAGGLAALTSAAPNVATAGITADAGKYDALGGALGDLTNQRRNAMDLYRQMGLV